jgi:hypothetical protein
VHSASSSPLYVIWDGTSLSSIIAIRVLVRYAPYHSPNDLDN